MFSRELCCINVGFCEIIPAYIDKHHGRVIHAPFFLITRFQFGFAFVRTLGGETRDIVDGVARHCLHFARQTRMRESKIGE